MGPEPGHTLLIPSAAVVLQDAGYPQRYNWPGYVTTLPTMLEIMPRLVRRVRGISCAARNSNKAGITRRYRSNLSVMAGTVGWSS